MSSIKVALELDDSQYQQRLREATSSVDKFAKANESAASGTTASFNKVVTSAESASNGLMKMASMSESASRAAGGLVTALAGLGAIEFVKSLLDGASASKDMHLVLLVAVLKR